MSFVPLAPLSARAIVSHPLVPRAVWNLFHLELSPPCSNFYRTRSIFILFDCRLAVSPIFRGVWALDLLFRFDSGNYNNGGFTVPKPKREWQCRRKPAPPRTDLIFLPMYIPRSLFKLKFAPGETRACFLASQGRHAILQNNETGLGISLQGGESPTQYTWDSAHRNSVRKDVRFKCNVISIILLAPALEGLDGLVVYAVTPLY
jgi:hypothetical protein